MAAGEGSKALRTAQRLLEKFPANPVLQDLYATALADQQIDSARDYVRQQLADAAQDPARRLAWLRRQARIELSAAEPSWLVFDLAVQQASALAPADLDIQACKGAATVLRGHAEEGGDILARTWRRNHGEVSDAELLAYLAIAARRVGNREAFARFRDAFDQVNTDQRLESLLIRYTA